MSFNTQSTPVHFGVLVCWMAAETIRKFSFLTPKSAFWCTSEFFLFWKYLLREVPRREDYVGNSLEWMDENKKVFIFVPRP